MSPKTKICELWISEQSGSHCFFPSDNDSARSHLDADAKLVWTVEARSWKHACSEMHTYLGLEPYKPGPDARDNWDD